MDIEEAKQLMREGGCWDCKGTHYGAHECNMEEYCDDFNEEVKQIVRADEKWEMRTILKYNENIFEL